MSHISPAWYCHIHLYKHNSILYTYMKFTKASQTLLGHFHVPIRRAGISAPSWCIPQQLISSHNLVFVGSLLKVSVYIYEISCSLLLMPQSGRKSSTCPKHYFTWCLGGLKPRPYSKGYRKTLLNDISTVFLESQAMEILSLITSSLG